MQATPIAMPTGEYLNGNSSSLTAATRLSMDTTLWSTTIDKEKGGEGERELLRTTEADNTIKAQYFDWQLIGGRTFSKSEHTLFQVRTTHLLFFPRLTAEAAKK